jgi:pyrroloquinoline quinone biosynthesis protein D
VIADGDRPRLAAKAMLRVDKKTGQHVLLYPEKGLVLNATGARILALCTGERTVSEIVAALEAEYTAGPVTELRQHVHGFLTSLAERSLLDGVSR